MFQRVCVLILFCTTRTTETLTLTLCLLCEPLMKTESGCRSQERFMTLMRMENVSVCRQEIGNLIRRILLTGTSRATLKFGDTRGKLSLTVFLRKTTALNELIYVLLKDKALQKKCRLFTWEPLFFKWKSEAFRPLSAT